MVARIQCFHAYFKLFFLHYSILDCRCSTRYLLFLVMLYVVFRFWPCTADYVHLRTRHSAWCARSSCKEHLAPGMLRFMSIHLILHPAYYILFYVVLLFSIVLSFLALPFLAYCIMPFSVVFFCYNSTNCFTMTITQNVDT